MDISKMSVDELKVLAFNLLKEQAVVNNNVKTVLAEIEKKEKEPAPSAESKQEKKLPRVV